MTNSYAHVHNDNSKLHRTILTGLKKKNIDKYNG